METSTVITEKGIWEETFNSIFKEVRFKKEKNVIHVFNGKSIRKQIRTKPNSNELSLPNVIMTYYDFDGLLQVRFEIYNQFVMLSPQFESNKLFLSFFKEWFENKLKMGVKRINIDNKFIMDKIK